MRQTLSLIVLSSLLVGCPGGGDGGGGTAATGSTVSGSVQAPNGQVAFNHSLSIYDHLALAFHGIAHASIAGLAPVSDGTVVQLIRLNGTATSFSVLSSTTTSGGRYSFNLTNLGLDFTNDLVIRVAGPGGKEMRAFVTTQQVDLNPGSELAVRLVTERISSIPGASLSRFTLQEVNDLTAALALLTTTKTFPMAGDLEGSIANVRSAVIADSTLMAFIAEAAADGQCTLGPGDQGNYFPMNVGNAWGYHITRTVTGSPTLIYTNGQSISGTRVLGPLTETIFYETNPADTGIPEEDYFVKDSLGIIRRGTSDSADPLTPHLTPYREVRFPLQAGSGFEQLRTGVFEYSQDLDGDGKNEQASVASTVHVAGFETVVTLVGSFANVVRIERSISITIFLSRGGSVPFSGSEASWFAPGVGQVKSTATLNGPGQSQTEVVELASYAVDGTNGGVGTTSLKIATGVTPANSDEMNPGRPGVATDGTNYLVASCRELGPSPGIFGVLISGGTPGQPFVISSIPVAHCGGSFPAVSFDGVNYLVVFNRGDGVLRGARVTKTGEVLDNPGFQISDASALPAVAFDGTNYLVIITKHNIDHNVYGVRVTPLGQVLNDFPISLASGDQILPAVSFDGANYFVVWDDRRNGTDDIFGARVTPAGTVLDTAGIPISTTSRFEEWPHLTFDGSSYMVVWNSAVVPPVGPAQDFEIRGARVTPSGSLLDGPPSNGGFPINTAPGFLKTSPTVTLEGNKFLVAWSQGNFDFQGVGRGIFGARLSMSGEIIEGGPVTSMALQLSSEPVPLGGRYVWPASSSNSTSTLLAWLSVIELSGATKEFQGSIIFH